MSQTADAQPFKAEKRPIQVMLVDDSAVVRGMIRGYLDPKTDIEVVATSSNGEIAVATLKRNPDIDLIVLDIEMPVMDGLTAIPLLLEVKPDIKIVMASTLTERNADISLRALAAGATDYVAKPSSGAGLSTADDFKRELIEKIYSLAPTNRVNRSSAPKSVSPVPQRPRGPVALQAGVVAKPAALAIGSSTGGPQALTRVLTDLDSTIGIPIFITQHMPATFTALLAKHLTRDTGHNVVEATDGQPVERNMAFLAPGDFHMTIEGSPTAGVIKLTQGPKVNFCRPSVDPMLQSLVKVYGRSLLTVILTGMGHDGRDGCQEVVAAGGAVLAQDEASSVVWGMPGAVAEAGLCRQILDLSAISPAIHKILGGAMT